MIGMFIVQNSFMEKHYLNFLCGGFLSHCVSLEHLSNTANFVVHMFGMVENKGSAGFEIHQTSGVLHFLLGIKNE
jgi:hypothetical protein